MSTITTAFALAVRPVHFDVSENKPGARPVRMYFKNREYCVAAKHGRFKDEFRAWQHAATEDPDIFERLRQSDRLDWRAYGLRGEMMLGLGWDRFKEMQDGFENDVVNIFQYALRALDAVNLTKATPQAFRVAKLAGITWLEVRAEVRVPYLAEPTTLVVLCLPSPVEEKTWSVRLRMNSPSDSGILETQSRFDVLIRDLSYQGITVKDVQNGTYLDL